MRLPELNEIREFAAFGREGTLTKAAKTLHISQPSLTRSMKRLEDALGAKLFDRTKNRIELNAVGRYALGKAERLLREAEEAAQAIREYERSLNTIRVSSCAPVPLWKFLPLLASKNPSVTIRSDIKTEEAAEEDLRENKCDIAILTSSVDRPGLTEKKFVTENLSVCLPRDHPALSGAKTSLSLADLNGYNCLLRSRLGFWEELCREKMPASKFLIQDDAFAFTEIANHSSLPFFMTNFSESVGYDLTNRVTVPISDRGANVTYVIAFASDKKYF